LTLQFYSHAISQDRMAAAGEMLTAILSHAVDQTGRKADEENAIGPKSLAINQLHFGIPGYPSNAD
jgi:hypothetical protein